MNTTRIAVERLAEEPFASVLCYPRATKREVAERMKELGKAGITALEFTGQKQVLNTHILGKGCVGLVTIAYTKKGKVALKIRRTDADRESMLREARLLEKANRAGVGPRLIGASKNLLVMQFVEGELLPRWLERTVSNRLRKRVLGDILEQCWKLDKVGLDHGELSHAPKHVIIDRENKPVIVDFETASPNRRPSNVTSICQFLLIRKAAAETARNLGLRSKKKLIEALRRYKKQKNRKNFEKVLESCGL